MSQFQPTGRALPIEGFVKLMKKPGSKFGKMAHSNSEARYSTALVDALAEVNRQIDNEIVYRPDLIGDVCDSVVGPG